MAVETTRTPSAQPPEPSAEAEEKVAPLELFFDLVFVLAITQVTAFIATDPTFEGLLRGGLILALIWWAWAAYAWLTNTLDTDETRVRLTMFGAMGAMFVVALAIPGAFGEAGLLFAVAYTAVRAAHILLFGFAANDVGVRAAARGLMPSVFIAAALLVTASFLDGIAQGALWAAAIVIDFGGPVVRGMGGWTLHPSHFAERHGLIVIIALGESIVATGIGAEGVALTGGVLAAAILGIAVAAALWWAYFDVVALVAERRLREERGLAQVVMARDSYSYLHLVMIAGIVLVALAGKKAIAKVDAPLDPVGAFALCGGVSLYLLGLIAFRLRNVRSLNRQRLVAAIASAALLPLAVNADALAAFVLITVVCWLLILYEAVRFREARVRVRADARSHA
jgi:low temperature requirement protein LtrA